MLAIVHSDRDGTPAFVFDLMEPERPKVNRAVCWAFLKSEALHPADFAIREDGVVRLNPELAKRVSTDVGPPTSFCTHPFWASNKAGWARGILTGRPLDNSRSC
jgi:hypothetical protein